ncbi:MAG: ABC transporter substrate-binding protein [Lachnospiraceae bacterium]|nr:ABC transporter substrate-binding protein [Lachnospiraceae bacterium]
MKKVFACFLLPAICMIALCACKGGTKKPGETKDGGAVVVGITQDLDSLDPHKAVAAGTREVLYNIFEGLVKPDKDGKLVAAVAESYEISADGTTYKFVLRSGVKFHNGATVTADDVVYSLKRCAGRLETSDPEVQVVPAFSVISDITASKDGDRDVITVTLSSPNTELIGYFTCNIIPKDYANQANSPVGTGPFKFVSYKPMDSLVMERFDDYYGSKAHLQKVTFSISENADAAFLKLQAGNIDIFPYLTVDQASELKGKFNIETGSMSLVQGLFLNNAVKPFDDVRVRKAMNYAVDKQELLTMLNGGYGTAIGSGMYSTFGLYYDKSLEGAYPHDEAKAKELLAEAGYADGFTFTVKVPSNYVYHVQTAEILVNQLKKVGITMKIEQIEWASWLSDVYKAHNCDATIIGLDSQLAPSDILKYYIGGSAKNFMNYQSTDFDTNYQKAIATVDTQAKVDLYHKLQKCLSDDAASVFLQSPSLMVAVNPKLAGYTFYPVYVQDMASVYFKEN